jgi:hypothetical protein
MWSILEAGMWGWCMRSNYEHASRFYILLNVLNKINNFYKICLHTTKKWAKNFNVVYFK